MSSSTPVPFSEAPWLSGFPSPYYNDSHRRWQKACRAFITENLTKHALEWERAELVPAEVYQTFAKANMLIPALPAPLPVEWLKKLGVTEMLGGISIDEWDYTHTAIYVSEMHRSGLAGPPGSLTVGFAFGIPPIFKFGSKALQEKFLPDLLSGKKRICIAITEPDAGSDVANIQTTARKSKDGKHYIVNGQKKWITNGLWSDYATMAVRTGGPGAPGLSLLIVPLKDYPGVTMRKIEVMGIVSSGTTYIDLDDVQVPVENLVGVEGQGMKALMKNFNHERLSIAISTATQARVALSTAFAYVLKREAFGAALMTQPVVRHRLAKAGAELEPLWSWVEHFVYQMGNLSAEEADIKLGGLTALCKAKAGMVIQICAETAVILYGGNGYTRSGQGELAHRLYRDAPGARIPGGSEDVMLDLAIRQLVKNFQSAEKGMERPRGDSKM